MLKRPTTDHKEILRWAERHGLSPSSGSLTPGPPVLFGLSFSIAEVHGGESSPLAIPWATFFRQFDSMQLALLFDESPAFEFQRTTYPGSFGREGASVDNAWAERKNGDHFTLGDRGLEDALIVAIELVDGGGAIARFSNGGSAEFPLQSIKALVLANALYIIPYS